MDLRFFPLPVSIGSRLDFSINDFFFFASTSLNTEFKCFQIDLERTKYVAALVSHSIRDTSKIGSVKKDFFSLMSISLCLLPYHALCLCPWSAHAWKNLDKNPKMKFGRWRDPFTVGRNLYKQPFDRANIRIRFSKRPVPVIKSLYSYYVLTRGDDKRLTTFLVV